MVGSEEVRKRRPRERGRGMLGVLVVCWLVGGERKRERRRFWGLLRGMLRVWG